MKTSTAIELGLLGLLLICVAGLMVSLGQEGVERKKKAQAKLEADVKFCETLSIESEKFACMKRLVMEK